MKCSGYSYREIASKFSPKKSDLFSQKPKLVLTSSHFARQFVLMDTLDKVNQIKDKYAALAFYLPLIVVM